MAINIGVGFAENSHDKIQVSVAEMVEHSAYLKESIKTYDDVNEDATYRLWQSNLDLRSLW